MAEMDSAHARHLIDGLNQMSFLLAMKTLVRLEGSGAYV